jgi:hypothetical protein
VDLLDALTGGWPAGSPMSPRLADYELETAARAEEFPF